MNIYSKKYTCLVCKQKSYSHHNGLTNHLKTHNLNSHSYYDKYLKKEGEGFCIICKKIKTTYSSLIKGYTKYCRSCAIKEKQWSGEKGQKRKEKLKKSMRENNISVGRPKNSKNINPYPMTDKVIKRLKDNPPPSWLGKKHKIETLEKMSESHERIIRENGGNMAYKGKFIPKNPQKYKGDPTKIIWRSTWEAKYMSYLDQKEHVILWSSEEIVVPYRDPLRGHWRRYFVDFWVQIKDSKENIKTYLIEIKPKNQTKPPEKKSKVTEKYINEVYTFGVNQAKWNAASEYCADRGWEFLIITEKELGLELGKNK